MFIKESSSDDAIMHLADDAFRRTFPELIESLWMKAPELLHECPARSLNRGLHAHLHISIKELLLYVDKFYPMQEGYVVMPHKLIPRLSTLADGDKFRAVKLLWSTERDFPSAFSDRLTFIFRAASSFPS